MLEYLPISATTKFSGDKAVLRARMSINSTMGAKRASGWQRGEAEQQLRQLFDEAKKLEPSPRRSCGELRWAEARKARFH